MTNNIKINSIEPFIEIERDVFLNKDYISCIIIYADTDDQEDEDKIIFVHIYESGGDCYIINREFNNFDEARKWVKQNILT